LQVEENFLTEEVVLQLSFEEKNYISSKNEEDGQLVPPPKITYKKSNSPEATGVKILGPIFPETKSKNERIPLLQPPFHIVQLGSPRSGSTFQYEVLVAITQLKNPGRTQVGNFFEYLNDTHVREASANNQSFVIKTHRLPENATNLTFFTTAKKQWPIFYGQKFKRQDRKNLIYHQSMKSLLNCSLCEIQKYQPIFGLSDEEVALIKRHMFLFEKIRQCCGFQMSKFNRLRLHGCNVTSFQDIPYYPWCEKHNMSEIELEFETSPFIYVPNNPEFNWAKPGDCTKFDKEIISGKDFNGIEFEGCEDK